MGDWLHSLQFRLIIGFSIILALALGSVSIYTGLAAQEEVSKFDHRLQEARSTRLEHLVSRYYSKAGGWAELQPALEQFGPVSGRRIVVTDQNGQIIGDSGRKFGRPWNRNHPGTYSLPIVVDDQEIGSVLVAPDDRPEIIPDPPATRLASAFNQSLLWTGLAAGLLGIFLISLLSCRILVPVNALNLAARRLGQGDLSQRVPTYGPREIGQLASTFNTMAENLQNAELQRRNLVADVAHELRTPVSNIQGYLEAAKDGLLETDEAVDTIYKQVMHLSALIEELRLLAMAEAGNLRLSLAPYLIADLLEESVEAIRPRAEAKGISLSLETPAAQSHVEVDRTRISQVLDNLLDNAIFHTPEGGSVTVSSTSHEHIVTVTVTDTGGECLPRCFQ